MIRHPAKLINEAKRLATEKHLSYKEIARVLKVSDSSISIWCRDLEGSNPRTYVKTSKDIRNLAKKADIGIFEGFKIGTRLAKIFCGIIYGCEGSKYPASNCLILTNSEPKLLNSFITLLRLAYKLDESKWRVRLQIHSDQDYAKLAIFWSDTLKIPTSKFYKPTVTKAREGKHRVGYLGTCSIKYYDYKLQLNLIGIYEEFMRKSSLLEDIPSG